MKKFIILLCSLLLLITCGCNSDVPPTGAEHDCTETSTHHPLNTYANLRDEADRINSFIRDENGNNLLPFDVTHISIDDSNSVILVGIKDINEDKIQYFREHISDKDFIIFEEGYNIVLTTE